MSLEKTFVFRDRNTKELKGMITASSPYDLFEMVRHVANPMDLAFVKSSSVAKLFSDEAMRWSVFSRDDAGHLVFDLE
jgi:hypothetical protein